MIVNTGEKNVSISISDAYAEWRRYVGTVTNFISRFDIQSVVRSKRSAADTLNGAT